MDRNELRACQASVKERYKADATQAWTPLHAEGDYRDAGITCTIDTFAGPTRAGLHVATGGDGQDACSADMLLEALVACAGVTLRSVATAMELELGRVHITADSHFDARGTLGMDRTVDAGVEPITVTVVIDSELDGTTATRLATSTERYCVVGQSLKHPPTIVIQTRRGPRR